MFVVTVTFEASPGQAENFERMLLKQARNSLQNEVACLRFDVARSTENPQQFFLYEIYQNAAAFSEHLETTHFSSFNLQAGPLVVEKQVQTWQMSPPGEE
jgi:autoinducer 2-degrading protein